MRSCCVVIAFLCSSSVAFPQVEAKLVASDGAADDLFGCAVAIDSDTLVVGASQENDHRGAAYVFVRDDQGVWTEQEKLVAADGQAGDEFGESVAISGDTVLVGVPNASAAYAYVREVGGLWSEQAKITASGGTPGNFFGCSVSIDGNRAVVGASADNGAATYGGTVFTFSRGAEGAWTQESTLTASDAADGDELGCSVGFSNDTAVAGALGDESGAGAAYVFDRLLGGLWIFKTKLAASDAAPGAYFGGSVAVDGDTIVVGARAMNGYIGAAYVFDRAAGVWSELTILTATDGAMYDVFGTSVAVDGETIVVGAPGDDDGAEGAGSAYVFGRSADGSWVELTKLTASDPSIIAGLGGSVTVDGETAATGASGDDHAGVYSGAAYVFAGGPIGSLVFSDGFESGDYGAWTTVLP